MVHQTLISLTELHLMAERTKMRAEIRDSPPTSLARAPFVFTKGQNFQIHDDGGNRLRPKRFFISPSKFVLK